VTAGSEPSERAMRRTRVGTQEIDLPLVPLADDLTIALLICVDHGVAFAEQAGRELAELLSPNEPELVVSVATMGIPLAIEATRALGLDDYVILHKTPKIHLGDALAEPVRSITTAAPQRLLLDRARVPAVRGRRVAVVDDVISTGASARAALDLMRRVEAEPVVIGCLMTEGSGWRATLGADASRVRSLGSMPIFRPRSDGSLAEDWGTED
jgi:adenine phosphoribosyltransferase